MDSVVSVKVQGPVGGSGQGSGFVYRLPGGYIITNHHVVDRASDVQVMFQEGEWREASLVGSDIYSDLAVLEVDNVPDYVNELEVAKSNPEPGTLVAALGNPFGLEETITSGIVSGEDRSMKTSGGFKIPDTVQTDAPINPGNSGGPLVNMNGTVVGVNRAKKGDNVGFAISPNILRQVVPELINKGRYRHAYLGVGMSDITPTVADTLNLERVNGVLVTQVMETGPSQGKLEGSTLKRTMSGKIVPFAGDVILSINNERVNSTQELSSYLATKVRPGDRVTLTVLRNGNRQEVQVQAGVRPPPREPRIPQGF
ncbi:MAG: S1C family serine protease [Halobacteria archaeon]